MVNMPPSNNPQNPPGGDPSGGAPPQAAPAGQGQVPPQQSPTHMEQPPASKQKRLMIAMVSLIAFIIAAVLLSIFVL